MKQSTYKVISALLIIVAILSAGAVAIYRINLYQSANEFKSLKATRDAYLGEMSPPTGLSDSFKADSAADESEPAEQLPKAQQVNEQGIKNWFLKLSLMNSDIAAWLQFDEANIDYPVMYTPKRPTYYLRKNFDEKYALCGTPFFDYRTDPNDDAKSELHLIYGHNMGDGTMFSHVIDYTDSERIDSAADIILDMPEQRRNYKVFAAMQLQEYTALADRFYNKLSIKDKKDFDAYIKFLRDVAVTSSRFTPLYGDDILVLSTCSKRIARGRFVLIAIYRQPEDSEQLN